MANANETIERLSKENELLRIYIIAKEIKNEKMEKYVEVRLGNIGASPIRKNF